MSIPEEKCRPSAESTMTRAAPSLDSAFTAWGSSVQKEGIIEFAFSGRLKRICAIPLGNSKIKTFVTHDFFLNLVRVISQSGTGASAIIAATMTSPAVENRLPQLTVSVISIGSLRHLLHPNWCDRLGNHRSNSRRRNMTQGRLADDIATGNCVGRPQRIILGAHLYFYWARSAERSCYCFAITAIAIWST